MPELGNIRERIRAVGGDADIGPRLLIRLRGKPDVFEAVVFAVIGEGGLGPRPLEYFESLGEALATFAVRDAIGLVGTREAAAPDPENQAALADLVDRRGLLSQSQRMAERSKALKQARASRPSFISHIRNSNLVIFEIQVLPAAQTFLSSQD